jgi:sugar phosphate isomerase/epimerase
MAVQHHAKAYEPGRALSRRGFMMASAGLIAMPRSSAQTTGLRLGLDTYTLRAFKWNALQLLDYAARMKLDTIQLDLGNYESRESSYVAKVRDQAARLGIAIDGSMGCICPTSSSWRPANRDAVEYLLTGLRVSKGAGASCMRVFIGSGAERLELAKHIDSTLKVLRAVRSQALDMGVKIAIENHGDFQAWELRDLIETAGKDYVAACLDSGNAVNTIEDPMVTLELLGPYTVTTHIRDSIVFEHPRGAVTQWVALGDGVIDFQQFFTKFRRVCPLAAVQLEILTGRAPRIVPFLEPEFWKAYPNARASEFARFLRLAKNGHPFMGSMVIASEGNAEYAAALREQQRIDLERSFVYARKLGLGLKSS